MKNWLHTHTLFTRFYANLWKQVSWLIRKACIICSHQHCIFFAISFRSAPISAFQFDFLPIFGVFSFRFNEKICWIPNEYLWIYQRSMSNNNNLNKKTVNSCVRLRFFPHSALKTSIFLFGFQFKIKCNKKSIV